MGRNVLKDFSGIPGDPTLGLKLWQKRANQMVQPAKIYFYEKSKKTRSTYCRSRLEMERKQYKKIFSKAGIPAKAIN